jgi:hypothetical protein
MTKNRPLIITFLGDLSILSVLLIVIPIFTEHYGYFMSPLPYLSGITSIVLPISLSILVLIASIGFLRLKKWGYWLLVSYNTFFLIMYIIWCIQVWSISIQNEMVALYMCIITRVILLIFIVPTINYFHNKRYE